jgi:hypothetical protein
MYVLHPLTVFGDGMVLANSGLRWFCLLLRGIQQIAGDCQQEIA